MRNEKYTFFSFLMISCSPVAYRLMHPSRLIFRSACETNPLPEAISQQTEGASDKLQKTYDALNKKEASAGDALRNALQGAAARGDITNQDIINAFYRVAGSSDTRADKLMRAVGIQLDDLTRDRHGIYTSVASPEHAAPESAHDPQDNRHTPEQQDMQKRGFTPEAIQKLESLGLSFTPPNQGGYASIEFEKDYQTSFLNEKTGQVQMPLMLAASEALAQIEITSNGPRLRVRDQKTGIEKTYVPIMNIETSIRYGAEPIQLSGQEEFAIDIRGATALNSLIPSDPTAHSFAITLATGRRLFFTVAGEKGTKLTVSTPEAPNKQKVIVNEDLSYKFNAAVSPQRAFEHRLNRQSDEPGVSVEVRGDQIIYKGLKLKHYNHETDTTEVDPQRVERAVSLAGLPKGLHVEVINNRSIALVADQPDFNKGRKGQQTDHAFFTPNSVVNYADGHEHISYRAEQYHDDVVEVGGLPGDIVQAAHELLAEAYQSEVKASGSRELTLGTLKITTSGINRNGESPLYSAGEGGPVWYNPDTKTARLDLNGWGPNAEIIQSAPDQGIFIVEVPGQPGQPSKHYEIHLISSNINPKENYILREREAVAPLKHI